MHTRALILSLVAPLLAAVASSPGHADDSDAASVEGGGRQPAPASATRGSTTPVAGRT